jgi:hypothetical protein
MNHEKRIHEPQIEEIFESAQMMEDKMSARSFFEFQKEAFWF